MNLETGLYDITGLAYSPKTKLLYAIDFAWMAAGEGGLFRLDADQKNTASGVKTVKIACARQADGDGLRPRRHALHHRRRPEKGRRKRAQGREAR